MTRIEETVNGYLDGNPPVGPIEMVDPPTIPDPETGEYGHIEPMKIYDVEGVLLKETDYCKLIYLSRALATGAEDIKPEELVNRLLSDAVEDALVLLGKPAPEVYAGLREIAMELRRRDG